MAILIANTGDKIVDTITQRNELAKKHDGMQVTVRDATADVSIGVGAAKYQWDAALNRWLVVWAEYMPSTVFHTEVKQIVGDSVSASAAPLNGVIWSAVALDGSVILGDVSVLSVVDKTITLFDSALNGKTLRFHYASSSLPVAAAPAATSAPTAAPAESGQTTVINNYTTGVDRIARAMSFL